MHLDARSDDDWIAGAVAAHERPLVAYVAHLLGRDGQDRARDVVQEAFARLCEQQPSAVRLPEWLFAVCRNLAIDRLRRERRMTTIDHDAIQPIADDATPDPSSTVTRADESKRASELLAALPPRQQEAVRLKFQHELSYAQIAHVMETTPNNVAVLIHTALRTLREQMK